MKQFSVSAACEIGCVRSNNEDMVLVGNKFIRNENYETTIPLDPISKKRYVFAIADGMGGHQAGEVASTDVLIDFDFFIYDLPERLSVSDFDEVVIEWLQSINRKIHLKGVSHPSLSDMGTTLVALVVYENRFFRLNCGDSRLYQLRNGRLTQLTTDHSLNTMMGESKHSNIITNCIGGGCTTSFMDIYDITDNLQSVDILLLCSDGLNDMVDDETICSMLMSGCRAADLAQAAIEAGGYDNVSACIVKID